MNDLAAEPKETIMIGDSYENDIIPAKAIGCFTVWVQNKSWTTSPDNSSADYKIDSIIKLPELLESLN